MAIDRRSFVRLTLAGSCLSTACFFPSSGNPEITPEDGLHIIGPKDGYSPHVGTLLSMMAWMRSVLLASVKNLNQDQLDELYDERANTIGSLLLHLAATERYYQISTFNWNTDFRGDGKIKWEAAMELGDQGRKEIRGNNLDYYLRILTDTRNITIKEFKKRDDKWLAKVDPTGFQNMPTNNYCKWFHVCEHESNHNGQIKWLRNRLKAR
jgi:uncharacterized damage-inducible protein DinB